MQRRVADQKVAVNPGRALNALKADNADSAVVR